VNRKRIPRSENDLWAAHPTRIAEALELHEIDYDEYAILSFLVDKIAAPPASRREIVYTLRGLSEALRWPHGNEWLRQKLHRLDRRWISFDNRRGPNAPWIFRLTGAEIDAELDESPTNFQLESPSELETNSNAERDFEPSTALLDRVATVAESPTTSVPRDETRAKNVLEGKNYDHVLGKTTSEPIRVEQAEDGSLVWNGEPRDGEEGVLADCQALVDAGLAKWIDNDEAAA
jgi:hypothetical protein